MTPLTIFQQAASIMAPTTAMCERAESIVAALTPPAALTDFNRRVAEMADALTSKKD
ncbi:hypothetical protein [Aquamicrobium zhengzhouense]|uniref:Uncharacterized protein n=1 Tax=Aquamicrobium zhengzhouense TaxID=2781738 RepID=A0ABS0SBW8_9HYPH|nr:hypothetical protein [Aquamicrobium zhengzhouense]MBI1620802.1 hypothetical protein [Aquamicrobium zhengzhouense]